MSVRLLKVEELDPTIMLLHFSDRKTVTMEKQHWVALLAAISQQAAVRKFRQDFNSKRWADDRTIRIYKP